MPLKMAACRANIGGQISSRRELNMQRLFYGFCAVPAAAGKRPLISIAFWLTLSIMNAALLFGQTAQTGALSGTITDPGGRVIAGAKIVVTSLATAEARKGTSNSNGVYVVPALLPGRYRVEISMTGFKTLTVPQAKVTVTETTALNLHLEVGAAIERITVQATTEPLETQSSALGQVTSGEQVRELPLVTRNFTQIMALNSG